MPRIALTGATGFVGGHVLTALLAAGCEVRALARRNVPALDRPSVVPVPGTLDDPKSLADLVRGCASVVHVAGLIQAPDPATFMIANAEGSRRLAEAAAQAGCRRFLYVSSLAAREPGISPYAASKAAGEAAVSDQAGVMAVGIVRPPAVYGPGDRATLPLLQALAKGWLIAPAGDAARFSLLHVQDLADLIGRLATADTPLVGTIEPDDGREGGYGWADLARLAEPVVGRKVRLVQTPRPVLGVVAALAEGVGRLAGKPPLLSRVKVAELFHPDWVCRPAHRPYLSGWSPRLDFARGLPPTLAWYREAGWL